MSTTASFVIDFGSEQDAFLAVELDDTRNNEKTSFSAGDVVYFRVSSSVPYSIHTSDESILTQIATEEVEEVKDELLTFVQSDKANLAKKSIGINTVNWYGNNLGNLSMVDVSEVKASGADEDSLGACLVAYNTQYDVWALTPPASMGAVYHIVVLVAVD